MGPVWVYQMGSTLHGAIEVQHNQVHIPKTSTKYKTNITYHMHTFGSFKCMTVVHTVGLMWCIGFEYAYLRRHKNHLGPNPLLQELQMPFSSSKVCRERHVLKVALLWHFIFKCGAAWHVNQLWPSNIIIPETLFCTCPLQQHVQVVHGEQQGKAQWQCFQDHTYSCQSIFRGHGLLLHTLEQRIAAAR